MNRLFKRLLSGATAASMVIGTLVFPAAAEVTDDDLLVSITFDEDGTSGSSFTATKGGTVTKNGAVTFVDSFDAEQGKAMYIASKSASNYLALPDGLLQGKQAATFSFWVKATSDGNPNWPFMYTSEESHAVGTEKYLGMLVNTGSMVAERYNNTTTRLSSVSASSTSDWQYITAVFESGGTRIYQNGKLIASDTVTVNVPALFTASSHTWLGHANWGSGEGFQGYIDDFKIYGKALSDDEVAAISKKASDREKAKIVEEKNCLEINTQFYANYGYTIDNNDVIVSVPNVGESAYTVIGAAYSDDALVSIVAKNESDVSKDTGTVRLPNLKKNENDSVKIFIWNSVEGLKPIDDIKVFQQYNALADGSSVKIRTTVTNCTPEEKDIEFYAIPYKQDGTEYLPSDAAGAPAWRIPKKVTLGMMESADFSQTVHAISDAAYYKVIVRDENTSYDAGYLPMSSVAFPNASPADSATTTEGAHDPTIFKDPVSGTFYAYSSHNLVFESKDLVNWTKHDYSKTITVPQTAKTFISSNYSGTTANGTYWAPDVLYKAYDEYPYWFYLSTSCGLGGRNSVISLVKAKSPGLWDGEYVDAGVVIASKENNNYNTNAIDANIYTDTDGKVYIVWGSFWKGIHGVELDSETGLAKGVDYTSDATILSSCQKFGNRLFSTPAGVVGPEGPWMTYNGFTGYRYMVTSYGWLGTNYNIRIARTNKLMSEVFADNPHRQFLDQKNRPVGATYADQVKEGGSLDELWGYKMLGSYQLGDGITYLGNGHCSVIENDGEWYLVEHCRKVADAVAYLQVRKMLWTDSGWPVVSPLVYAGEGEQVIPEEMLYGTWDLASVGHTILDNGVTDVSKSGAYKGSDLPVLSSKIILQADGKLGDNLGTWTFDNDHTVTINFDYDGNSEDYEFYKSGDTMKLFVLTGYDKDKRESALVMTGTDQNDIAQFAKKNNQAAQATKLTPRIEATPVTIEKSSGGNPILGFDGDNNMMYAGDPAALVDGDKVYMYAGHDTSTDTDVSNAVYRMPEWVCYSTTDMKNFTYEGVTMHASDISWANDTTSAWASQVIKHCGKYYMYYCTWDKTSSGKQSIGVAVSDSPTGPFTDPLSAPLVKGTLTEPQSSNWNDIDPTVWVETVDGVEHRYLAWGNGIFYVCELNEDMTSVKDLDGDGQITMGNDVKQQSFTGLQSSLGYTEAPWIYRQTDESGEYTGKYYLFAAFGWREQMGYATSDSMYGPWAFGGIIMPPTATSNTNHPAVIDFKGHTYFIYHNGSLPAGSGYRRVVCAEEFTINSDGTIDPIQETSTGLSDAAAILYTDAYCLSFDEFTNSSSDNDYPIKKSLVGYKIPQNGEETSPKEVRWKLKQGKSDSSDEHLVSIESYTKPGLYVTASGNDIILTQQNTLSADLALNMTFRTVEGINGDSGSVSFESAARKGCFLTIKKDGSVCLTNGADADACTFNLGGLD